jgi:hypothetical protein
MAYKERILDDDYPVFASYIYIADGKLVYSPVSGKVRDLKRELGASEVRCCDIVGRMADVKPAAD